MVNCATDMDSSRGTSESWARKKGLADDLDKFMKEKDGSKGFLETHR